MRNKRQKQQNGFSYNSFSKSRKAAMEMSVGTMVTIVLLMIVLVLGIVLTRNIFSSAKGAIDLTDQQLKNELGKAFGSEDQKVVIYPDSKKLEIKQEQRDSIGVGIRNLVEGTQGTLPFSYSISVGQNNCGSAVNPLSWIEIGGTENNMAIPVGDFVSRKVDFRIPTGSPLCIVRYAVTVKQGTAPYDINGHFDIIVKAK